MVWADDLNDNLNAEKSVEVTVKPSTLQHF